MELWLPLLATRATRADSGWYAATPMPDNATNASVSGYEPLTPLSATPSPPRTVLTGSSQDGAPVGECAEEGLCHRGQQAGGKHDAGGRGVRVGTLGGEERNQGGHGALVDVHTGMSGRQQNDRLVP